ncbi:MAG TPA: YbhB/YbcL family Raf kinase inhibitor-like protein [Puia sp.]|nr:YbhB/YbcL family Raf kinase inhibitor-like protein [Puia sp.]
MEYLHITSPEFRELSPIPIKYTRSGANINPPLDLDRIPGSARSLVILMEDPDARERLHWMAWNIPVVRHIGERRPMECEGKNDFGQSGYTGPFLPFGVHRYQFKVYALDIELDLPAGSSLDALTRAMSGHILGSGELNGIFTGTRVLKARAS